MRRRHIRWIMFVCLAVLLSGCSLHGSIRWDVTYYSVSGIVRQWPLGMPLQNAEVFFNGKVDVRKVTDEHGAYSAFLPAGTYRVTIRSAYGEHRETVRIENSGRLDFHVEADRFRSDLFAALSGMRRYEMRDGHLDWKPGVLERWTKSEVSIFFRVDDSVSSWLVPRDWDNTMYREATEWERYLRQRITLRRRYTDNADIRIELVPPGALGNFQAIHRRDAYNGHLEHARIWIDVEFIQDRSLRLHELAHALGIEHSFEPESVMYPQKTSYQRSGFTEYELDLIRLMYDSPPGMRYVGGTPYDMSLQSIDATEKQPLVEQDDSGHTVTAYGMTLDGEKVELSVAEVERIRNQL